MNIEIIGITSLVKDLKIGREAEAISASYARCSRSPEDLSEIREKALNDVEKTRDSNKKIVFEMGHSSIAEHVVLNIDINQISRLAIEHLEHHRLASFTEKSQRYQKIDQNGFIPSEMLQTFEREKRFHHINKYSKAIYQELNEKLPSLKPSLGDPSREDARYALLMSTPSQLGMTVNARTLELMIKRLRSIDLAETQLLSQQLESKANHLIPSLIRYTDPLPRTSPLLPSNYGKKSSVEKVKLLNFTENADQIIAAGLLSEFYGTPYYPDKLPYLTAEEIIISQLRQLSPHCSVPRAFELANFTFEVILSASAFAQLKRHRLATILPGPLDPDLGVEIPPSLIKANLDQVFTEYINEVNKLWKEDGAVKSSSYLLTNAHRRRVIISFNLREFYHITRLRMDKHAQWEIRNIVTEMLSLINKKAPLSTSLCGGKDKFHELKI
ncbi:MAG: FAD-dependent thymidylate synthase [bacterium]